MQAYVSNIVKPATVASVKIMTMAMWCDVFVLLGRVREVSAYEMEVKENEAHVQKMREDGRDPYDIKKQVQREGMHLFCANA